MKKIMTMLALMLPMVAFGQWRMGVNGGADLNHFIIDKQYQTDYQFKDRWGATIGIMGQYDIADWVGIRAELDWMQRDYRQTRENLKVCNYKYTNNYLLLPVMGKDRNHSAHHLCLCPQRPLDRCSHQRPSSPKQPDDRKGGG